MRRKPQNLTPWDRLYNVWSGDFRAVAGVPVEQAIEYADVPVPHRSQFGVVADFDFWPRGLVAPRIAEVRGYTNIPSHWQSNKAVQATASLIWSFRRDPELLALTFMAAWIHGKSSPGDPLRGEELRKLEEVVRSELVQRRIAGDVRWHHASRDTLPVSLEESLALRRFFFESSLPHDHASLASLAALAAVLSLAPRVVVRIGNPEALRSSDERYRENVLPPNVLTLRKK